MPTPPQSSSSDLSLHLLSNGRYRVEIGARGEGCSSLGELRLIGGSNPPEIHEKGMFLFLRDLDRDRVWSAGLEPTSVLPRIYEIEKSQDRFVISRMDGDIQLRMECCVVPDHDAELRRLQLTNSGSQTLKLELSSYAEVVLNDPAAHDSHPAFSKLFLQTEFVPESSALLVRRRPRSPEEGYPCLVHAILDRPVDEYETDRARFLGRRKHPEQARALRGPDPLSCTTGNVLDPIVSLRSCFRLKPGESIEICLLLGAPPTRAEALSLVECYAEAETRDAVFREAARAASHRETMIDEATSFPATAPSGDEPRVDEEHEESSVEDRAPEEELLFFNGYGGFNEEGTEYVIRLPWRKGKGLLYPPQAWINVLANENFGALLSETGAGYTWSDNSRLGKLTPWQNDPVLDPHSEAFYLRDEKDGSYGSPLPGPTPFAAPYEVRHGFGYTRCQVRSHDILCDTTVFVGRDDPIRFVRIQLRNESNRSRHLSLFAYARLLLADSFTAQSQELVSEATASPGRLRARGAGNANGSPLHALADLVVESTSATIHTTAKLSGFVGLEGKLRRPHCLEHSKALEFEEGRGDQACFAQQVEFELERGSSSTVVFLLGGAASQEALEAAFERYQSLPTVDAAEEEVVAFWKQQLSTVHILTPSRELDLMVNGWLPYQTLSCRLWARSALYQSGGAFGFRDQLQDASSLTHVSPERSRAQILLHAAHQFVEGDVLHWWHPPHDQGIRTRFVDDLIWLPHLTADYIQTTGDSEILAEEIPFVHGPQLQDGQDEVYMAAEPAGVSASLYEHCCRALDRSLVTGAHGLPLFGTGDWNDGMNRVGRLGRGESTWMGFFLYLTLGEFLVFCEERGDTQRVENYRRYRDRLPGALNHGGWDGQWYRRGYYDDGAALGSAENKECRIDGLVQAWSVLSGVGPPDRAAMAVDAADTRLVSEGEGLIRLLTPPFSETKHDPGYIKGYVSGVRENGGQYTHAALWLVRAMAQLRRRDRVAPLLDLLNPICRTLTQAQVDSYRLEPYVVAADVYGTAPHVGRGGWSWYTGSSGWMSRVALESLLGLRIIAGRILELRPCIPDDWPGFTIEYRPLGGQTVYSIAVRNHDGRAEKVSRVWMDEELLPESTGQVPLLLDGRRHSVRIDLGSADALSSTAELG